MDIFNKYIAKQITLNAHNKYTHNLNIFSKPEIYIKHIMAERTVNGTKVGLILNLSYTKKEIPIKLIIKKTALRHKSII